VSQPYLDRLGARIERTGSALCLGIDPDPAALPDGYARDLAGVERFARLILEAAVEHASAVKINLAFFEAFGSAGVAALERIRAAIPGDVPFIADAKRGDIGSSSEQHARALYDRLDAHAVTASPYLGAEAIGPLLDRPERFVYVLCRTSNPGAAELQGLEIAADPVTGASAERLALRVARLAAGWARHPGTVGLVVGATAPGELAAIRATAPQLPFLVPGIGSQGGDLEATLRHGPAREATAAEAVAGGALLVNVSRGIAKAALGTPDPEMALRAEAQRWAQRLVVLG
jgi:orotidine-5'-phosphate decarboxylase